MSTNNIKTVVPEIAESLYPKELVEFLIAMIMANQPVMLWGQPGVGKSDLAVQVGHILKHIYHDIRPLLMERIDLLGIPFVESVNEIVKTKWAEPGFLPDQRSTDRHLINIEELTSAKQDMQSALYQLILNRQCGDYKLPEGARMMACGNRYNDRGVTHKMPTPLASRFIHVQLVPSVEDWLEWAFDNDIDNDVIFFIRFIGKEEALNYFNPKAAEAAFPCPRTWQQISRVKPFLQDKSPTIQRAAYIGSVGRAIGTDFWTFLECKNDLPSIKDVLLNPEDAKIPSDPSQQILLCSSLLRIADQHNFSSICDYTLRLQPEISHFTVQQATRKDPSLKNSNGYTRWAALTK